MHACMQKVSESQGYIFVPFEGTVPVARCFTTELYVWTGTG